MPEISNTISSTFLSTSESHNIFFLISQFPRTTTYFSLTAYSRRLLIHISTFPGSLLARHCVNLFTGQNHILKSSYFLILWYLTIFTAYQRSYLRNLTGAYIHCQTRQFDDHTDNLLRQRSNLHCLTKSTFTTEAQLCRLHTGAQNTAQTPLSAHNNHQSSPRFSAFFRQFAITQTSGHPAHALQLDENGDKTKPTLSHILHNSVQHCRDTESA